MYSCLVLRPWTLKALTAVICPLPSQDSLLQKPRSFYYTFDGRTPIYSFITIAIMDTPQPKPLDMRREHVEELADSLARAFNAVEIPCVLWGHYLLSLWGVPTYTSVRLYI